MLVVVVDETLGSLTVNVYDLIECCLAIPLLWAIAMPREPMAMSMRLDATGDRDRLVAISHGRVFCWASLIRVGNYAPGSTPMTTEELDDVNAVSTSLKCGIGLYDD